MKSVLLLHGFAGAPTLFEPLGLAERARVYAPVLSGHIGISVAPHATPPPSSLAAAFDEEVRQLEGWCRQSGFRSGHLVGYSLGARLGLGLLLRAGDLFTGATLIGGHPGIADAAERHARGQADAERAAILEAQGVETFMRSWESEAVFAGQSTNAAAEPGFVSRLALQAAVRRSHTATGLASVLRALSPGRMPQLGGGVASLKFNVDLVAGELDQKFSALLEPLAHSATQARFVAVPGAGHNPVIEQPRAVANLLRPYL